jgi:hypothetical protein
MWTPTILATWAIENLGSVGSGGWGSRWRAADLFIAFGLYIFLGFRAVGFARVALVAYCVPWSVAGGRLLMMARRGLKICSLRGAVVSKKGRRWG